jgi:hypothetical protein
LSPVAAQEARRMAEREGFEPVEKKTHLTDNQNIYESRTPSHPQIHLQGFVFADPQLAEIVANWIQLHDQLRQAILAIIRSGTKS